MFEFVNHILNYSLTMSRNTMNLKKEIEKLKKEMKEMKEKEELNHRRMVRMVKVGYGGLIYDICYNPITKRWENRMKVTPKLLLKEKNKLKSPTDNRRSDETIFIEKSYYFEKAMKRKDKLILQLESKNNDKCKKLVEKADQVCCCINWLLGYHAGPRRVGRARNIRSESLNIARKMYELRCELAGTKYGRLEVWGRKPRLYTPDSEWRAFYNNM